MDTAKETFSFYCVVPENIHTLTTEGIGNSGGVGRSKAQENPEERGGGGGKGKITSQGVNFVFFQVNPRKKCEIYIFPIF